MQKRFQWTRFTESPVWDAINDLPYRKSLAPASFRVCAHAHVDFRYTAQVKVKPSKVLSFCSPFKFQRRIGPFWFVLINNVANFIVTVESFELQFLKKTCRISISHCWNSIYNTSTDGFSPWYRYCSKRNHWPTHTSTDISNLFFSLQISDTN